MTILYQIVLLLFAINFVRSITLLVRMWRHQAEADMGAEAALLLLITFMSFWYIPLQFQWVFGERDTALPGWETFGWICFDLYLCGVVWAVESYIARKFREARQ